MEGNVGACPSLGLEVRSTESIKQDCNGTCFYHIMLLFGGQKVKGKGDILPARLKALRDVSITSG